MDRFLLGHSFSLGFVVVFDRTVRATPGVITVPSVEIPTTRKEVTDKNDAAPPQSTTSLIANARLQVSPRHD